MLVAIKEVNTLGRGLERLFLADNRAVGCQIFLRLSPLRSKVCSHCVDLFPAD